MRKFKNLGAIHTGSSDYNNTTFDYFYERVKNDVNGNARYAITIILYSTVLQFVSQCYEFAIPDIAERFVDEYLEAERMKAKEAAKAKEGE